MINVTYQCPACSRAQHIREGQTACVSCGKPLVDVVFPKGERVPQPGDELSQGAKTLIDAYRTFGQCAAEITRNVTTKTAELHKQLSDALVRSALADARVEGIADFLKEPFIVERIAPSDYYIHVPAFLNMHVGWPVKVGRSYTTYRLNIYSAYGTGGLPEWVKEHITLPDPPDITIEEEATGNYLVVGNRSTHQVMAMFPNLLDDPQADGRYPIRGGDEELYLVRMLLVKEGLLLPKNIPVDTADLLPDTSAPFQLQDHQLRDWQEFLNHGRIGIFKPPRGGKSYTGLYACSRMSGTSIVFAPSLTLVDQWNRWAMQYGMTGMDVWTYQGAVQCPELRTRQFDLAVFDEVHRCPSPEFRKLACLHYKYSIGLSASPFREDGQEAQIYALTGKPVFCDWETHFSRNVDVVLPRVRLLVYANPRARVTGALRLVNEPRQGRTLLFVEHLKVGNYLSSILGVPFWHHKCLPPNGEMFAPSEGYWARVGGNFTTVIVSRIADEGLQIDGLTRIIEVESIGDSRRQTVQRFGRLLANTEESEYILLMTQEERVKHERKLGELFSLEGFTIHEEVVTTD